MDETKDEKQSASAGAPQKQMQLSTKLAEASAVEAEGWAEKSESTTLKSKAEYALRKVMRSGGYAMMCAAIVEQTNADGEVRKLFNGPGQRATTALLRAGQAYLKAGGTEPELQGIADEILGVGVMKQNAPKVLGG